MIEFLDTTVLHEIAHNQRSEAARCRQFARAPHVTEVWRRAYLSKAARLKRNAQHIERTLIP